MTARTVSSISDLNIGAHDLNVLTFFRGEWCPFCQSHLRELNGAFRQQVEAAGGQIIGITSQSAEAAQTAHDNWALDYDVVSDPSNQLARSFDINITPKAASPLAEHPTEYPNGMSQSGVIVLNRAGEVLYRWAVDPTVTNLFGSSDRPLPDEIWAAIQAALAGTATPPAGEIRLDPAFLEANYPEQHAHFLAFAATLPEDVQRQMGVLV